MTQNNQYLQKWLLETPKYTVFRVNKLMDFDIEKLKNHLEEVHMFLIKI